MNLNLEYREINDDKNKYVLFLHGWGMNKNCYEKIASSINCKSITLDFFGFGKSGEPNNYFDTYEYAYYVYVFLKSKNINSISIVGHSFGGRVAILLSSIFDIEVNFLFLTSSAGININSFGKKLKVYYYKLFKFLVNKKLLNARVLKKFGSKDYKNCNENLRSVFVKVVNQDLKKHLHKITCNTILIWDKKDKDTPYKICKILKINIENSRKILFKNGKHFAFLYNQNKFINIINNNIA